MAAQTSRSAVHYRGLALSPNTIKCYASDLKRYRSSGGKIPASPRALASYLARQAPLVRPATIMRRLAAIAYEHTRRGYASPTRSTLVQQTLKGIRRAAASTTKQAKPLSVDTLRQITRAMPSVGKLRDGRDRAILLLGFAGGFRRSELASLRLQDLNHTAQGLLIRLRKSKTDPYGTGREVAIPYARQQRFCPVHALRRWLLLYAKASECPLNAETPLFAQINRYGHVRTGLSASSISAILRDRLRLAGMDADGYSAHSLRAGLVTSAARAGVPTWAIQRQTGHRSHGSVHRYIRNVPAFEMNAVKALL